MRHAQYIAILVAALVAAPAGAWAQGRGAHVWNSPGSSLAGPGGVGGNFQDYSYGLGGLSRSAPPGSDVLRSNIGGGGGYNILRAMTAAPVTDSNSPFSRSLAASRYNVPGVDLGDVKNYALPEAVIPRADTNISYLTALGGATQLRDTRGEPVVSLVPSEPSTYQTHMSRGDDMFRSGKYGQALSAFKIAETIGSQVPESHLAVLQAAFATGEYHTAAFHLRQALRYLPELPLVSLQIRKFYGDDHQADFDQQLDRLRQEAVDPNRVDMDLLTLQVYLLYYDGHVDEAIEMIRENRHRAKRVEDPATGRALSTEEIETLMAGGKLSNSNLTAKDLKLAAKDLEGAKIRESLSIFWDALAQTGKVTGSLYPPVSSAPASGPASAPTSLPADLWPEALKRAGGAPSP